MQWGKGKDRNGRGGGVSVYLQERGDAKKRQWLLVWVHEKKKKGEKGIKKKATITISAEMDTRMSSERQRGRTPLGQEKTPGGSKKK